jgi:hypothetical protein
MPVEHIELRNHYPSRRAMEDEQTHMNPGHRIERAFNIRHWEATMDIGEYQTMAEEEGHSQIPCRVQQEPTIWL